MYINLKIDGITIFISKLAPVAIVGTSSKTKSLKSGSYDFLDLNAIDTVSNGNWED